VLLRRHALIRRPSVDGRRERRISASGALADTLELAPVDDLDVFLTLDLVDMHQSARRQLVDHRAHAIVFYGVAWKHLHPDGARPQGPDAEIVGEAPDADEQEAGHRCAVDDGLPGPDV